MPVSACVCVRKRVCLNGNGSIWANIIVTYDIHIVLLPQGKLIRSGSLISPWRVCSQARAQKGEWHRKERKRERERECLFMIILPHR